MDLHDRFRFIRHKYWHQKSGFDFEKDLYEVWTIFIIEAGRFEYVIDESTGIAEPGQAVVCPPGTWFGRVMLEPLSFHFLQFQYQPQTSPESFPYGMVQFSFQDRVRYESTLHLLRNDILSRSEYRNVWKEQLLNAI